MSIRTTKIEHKAYRLTRPINNPNPDGRVKHDFTAKKQFPAGMYRVETVHQEFDGIEFTPIHRIKKLGAYGELSNKTNPEQFDLLMANLEPEEGTVTAPFERYVKDVTIAERFSQRQQEVIRQYVEDRS